MKIRKGQIFEFPSGGVVKLEGKIANGDFWLCSDNHYRSELDLTNGAKLIHDPHEPKVGSVVEWLEKRLSIVDDANCGVGMDGVTTPDASARDLLIEQLREQFRFETLRTSKLTELLMAFINYHKDSDHVPGPWSRACTLCWLVKQAEDLIASPINNDETYE